MQRALAEEGVKGRGCLLCRYIREDLKKHGRLTEYTQSPPFPARAKVWHLWAEGILKRRSK